MRRHLVSDREKLLNTLPIHTFHPGLPGRPRLSRPLIRSAFCNYSTSRGVRGVQLVQALALPCPFVAASPLGPCVIFILRHFPRPLLFNVFVSYDYCYILSPDDSQRSCFRFRPPPRGPSRDRLLWSARSFC